MNFILLIIVYALISAGGLALVKHGFATTPIRWGSFAELWASGWSLLGNFKFLLGMFLYLSGFVLWLGILSQKQLSYAFPIASGALYIAIVLTAYAFLGETISPLRLFGIALIGLGAILIGITL